VSERLDWLKPSKGRKVKLFYFTSAEHVVSNVRKNRIKISRFKECNDLFELSSIDLRFTRARTLHKAWANYLDTRVGLICFSAEWSSPLMWAHYGKNGTGACMVLEASWENVIPVRYTSVRELPRKDYTFPTDTSSDNFRSMVSTKYADWAYEREIRTVVDLASDSVVVEKGKDGRELNFLSLDNGFQILGVIRGPQSNISAQTLLEGDSSLSLCATRLAYQSYRMIELDEKAPFTTKKPAAKKPVVRKTVAKKVATKKKVAAKKPFTTQTANIKKSSPSIKKLSASRTSVLEEDDLP
jgi:hypothetical protein